MSSKFIESKSDYSTDAVNNRLTRLEKILEKLTLMFGYSQDNITNNQVDNPINRDFSIPLIKGNSNNLHKAVTMGGHTPLISQKSNKNNLLLSRGQVIAEIAAAILRANQRNF